MTDEPRKPWYGAGKQPWDTIKALGWAPAFAAANVVKYLRRTKDPEHSLESAQWYHERIREMANSPAGEEIYHQLLQELNAEEWARLTGGKYEARRL